MDRPIVISEKRGITITLGVLIHFLVTVAVVVGGYLSIKEELATALDQSRRNEIELKVTRDSLDRARMDIIGLTSKFDQFLSSYDRDMNKYVRENVDRR